MRWKMRRARALLSQRRVEEHQIRRLGKLNPWDELGLLLQPKHTLQGERRPVKGCAIASNQNAVPGSGSLANLPARPRPPPGPARSSLARLPATLPCVQFWSDIASRNWPEPWPVPSPNSTIVRSVVVVPRLSYLTGSLREV